MATALQTKGQLLSKWDAGFGLQTESGRTSGQAVFDFNYAVQALDEHGLEQLLAFVVAKYNYAAPTGYRYNDTWLKLEFLVQRVVKAAKKAGEERGAEEFKFLPPDAAWEAAKRVGLSNYLDALDEVMVEVHRLAPVQL